MNDQRDFFRGAERDYWTQAEGLKDEELGLIQARLDPALATLDAGTGGGRIARALAALDFGHVTGFDFAPEMIDAARAADEEDAIRFDVADATALPFPDESFDQTLYLQQIVCTIEDPAGREAALAEAARVLRPRGLALLSFVCLESRMASRLQRAFVAYLRGARRLRRNRRAIQSMPRLRLRGHLDPRALRDAGPHVWWYRAHEVEAALRAAGLDPVGFAFAADARSGTMHAGVAQALVAGAGGELYALARKA